MNIAKTNTPDPGQDTMLHAQFRQNIYPYYYPFIPMDEQFRRVSDFLPEYRDYYWISNYGRLYNANSGYLCTPTINEAGYTLFNLRRTEEAIASGKPRDSYIGAHILVCTCFVGPKPGPKYQVNHRDFRRSNNYYQNLEWTTPQENLDYSRLAPTLSMGIGYTSPAFGIGLGYNYTFANDSINGGYIGVHTPVLMVNALNNNLRIAVPIQVAVKDYDYSFAKVTYTGVAFDNIQLRYYTGIDAFNAIRLYFYYRNSSVKANDSDYSAVSEAFGFQARFYFLNTQIGNVTVNPYLKVAYNTALQGDHVGDYTAETFASPITVNDGTTKFKQSDFYEANAYNVTAAAVLGITANSDIVSLYVEPSLGYTASAGGKEKGAVTDPTVTHKLYWGAYTELYIRPTQDLEWYFEMDVNNGGEKQLSNIPVYFETTTGITWYLPAFDGAQ